MFGGLHWLKSQVSDPFTSDSCGYVAGSIGWCPEMHLSTAIEWDPHLVNQAFFGRIMSKTDFWTAPYSQSAEFLFQPNLGSRYDQHKTMR